MRKCETSVEEIILEAIKAPDGFIAKKKKNPGPGQPGNDLSNDPAKKMIANQKAPVNAASVKDLNCSWFSSSKFSSSGKMIGDA